MASQQEELLFIMRMRDEAAKVLNDTIRGFGALGDEVKEVDKGFSTVSGTLNRLKGLLATVGIGFGALKFGSLIKDSTLLNARFETLGVVLDAVGKNIGKTGLEMKAFSSQVQGMGITMNESRQTVVNLAQAQLDLAEGTKLARVAQDAAVIGMTNSSEALSRMVYGVKTAQNEVLQTIGINVSWEQSYAKLAATLKKSADSLTVSEKTTARLNAVLEEGQRIAGTYEASMGTASKQLGSMARYIEDLKNKIGTVFTPAFTSAVFQVVDVFKEAHKAMDDLERSGVLRSIADALTAVVDQSGALTIALAAGLVARGMVPVAIKAIAMGRALSAAATQFGIARTAAVTFGGAMNATLAALGGWVGILSLVAAGIAFFAFSQSTADKAMAKFGDTTKKTKKEFSELLEAEKQIERVNITAEINQTTRDIAALQEALKKGQFSDAFSDFMRQFEEGGSDYRAAVSEIRREFRASEIDLQTFIKKLSDLGEQFPQFADHTAEILDMASAIQKAADHVEELRGKLGTLDNRLGRVIDVSKTTQEMDAWIKKLGLVRYETQLVTKAESERKGVIEEYGVLMETVGKDLEESRDRLSRAGELGLSVADVNKLKSDIAQLETLFGSLDKNRDQINTTINEKFKSGIEAKITEMNREADVMRKVGIEREREKSRQEAIIAQYLEFGRIVPDVMTRWQLAWARLQGLRFDDFARDIDASTSATQRLADAQGKGSAAIQEAQIQAKAEQEVLKYGEAFRGAIIQRLREEARARNQLRVAQVVAELKAELVVMAEMIEAHKAGSIVVADARAKMDAYRLSLTLTLTEQEQLTIAAQKFTKAMADLAVQQAETNKQIKDDVADSNSALDAILGGSTDSVAVLKQRAAAMRQINDLKDAASKLDVVGTTDAKKLAAEIRKLAAEYEALYKIREKGEQESSLAGEIQRARDELNKLNAQYESAYQTRLEQEKVLFDLETERNLRGLDRASEAAVEYQKLRDEIWDTKLAQEELNTVWEYGATKALNEYMESARNVADQTQQLFSKAFKGIEDALVDMVTTGKFSFKGLVNSIISDLARIEIRSALSGVLGSLAGGGSGGSGLLGSLLGSVTGGGRSGGGGSGGIGLNPLSSITNFLGGGQGGGLIGGLTNLSSNYAAGGISGALFGTAGVDISGGLGAIATEGSAGLLGTGGAFSLSAAAPYALAAIAALSLLSGSFGRKPSVGPTTVGRVTDPLNPDSAVFSFDNGGSSADTLKPVIQAIADAIKSAEGQFRGVFKSGFGYDLGYFPSPEDGNSQASGFNLKFIVDNILEDKDRFKGLTAEEAVDKATFIALKEAIDYNSDLLDIVAKETSKATDAATLTADLQWAQEFEKLEMVIDDLGSEINANTIAVVDLQQTFKEAGEKQANTFFDGLNTWVEKARELFDGSPYSTSGATSVAVVSSTSPSTSEDDLSSQGRGMRPESDPVVPITAADVTAVVRSQEYLDQLARTSDALDIAKARVSQFLGSLSGDIDAQVIGTYEAGFLTAKATAEASREGLEAFNEQVRQAYEDFPELTGSLGELNDALIDVDDVINNTISNAQGHAGKELILSLQDELDPASKSLRDLNDWYEMMQTQAENLGVSAEAAGPLLEVYNQRLREINATLNASEKAAHGFNRKVALQILDLMDPWAAKVEQVYDEMEQLRDEAASLGVEDTGAIDTLESLKLAAIEDQKRTEELQKQITTSQQWVTTWKNAVTQIGRTIQQLTTGDLSPLSATDQLASAKKLYNDLLTTSKDESDLEAQAEAIADLPAAAESLLTVAQDLYASGPEYAAIWQQVVNDLSSAKSTAEVQLSLEQTQVSLLQTQIDQADSHVKEILAAIGQIDIPGVTTGSKTQTYIDGVDYGYNASQNQQIKAFYDELGLTWTGAGEGQIVRDRLANAELDALIKSIGHADGGVFSNRGRLPLKKFAAGGIATSPMFSLFGEGSKPEAYVPLDDGRTIPVTVSMTGSSDTVGAVQRLAQIEADGFLRLERRLISIEESFNALADDLRLARA